MTDQEIIKKIFEKYSEHLGKPCGGGIMIVESIRLENFEKAVAELLEMQREACKDAMINEDSNMLYPQINAILNAKIGE